MGGSPCASVVKNPFANAGDMGSIPGSGRSPGEGNGNPLHILAKEIPWTFASVHSKGDQPWVFFGRNDAKTETPVLCPPHAKS